MQKITVLIKIIGFLNSVHLATCECDGVCIIKILLFSTKYLFYEENINSWKIWLFYNLKQMEFLASLFGLDEETSPAKSTPTSRVPLGMVDFALNRQPEQAAW